MTELSEALVITAKKVAIASSLNNEEIAQRTLYWQLAECIEYLEDQLNKKAPEQID